MERICLSETLEVSRIVQGLMRLTSWGFTKYDFLHHIEKLLDFGITTFDNADIYGDYTCEARLGEVLSIKPGLRKEIQIITKCGIKILSDKFPERRIKHYDTSKEHLISSVNHSLQNLKTDYLDLLLIHHADPFMDPIAVSEAFHYLYKSGKVLNFGVANFKPSNFNLLQKFFKLPLVTNQIKLSPLNLTHFTDGTVELCQEYEIPPMAASPLAGGAIFSSSSEKAINLCQKLEDIAKRYGINSLDTICYSFLTTHPSHIIPIVGTANINRIGNAVKALDLKLSNEEWFEIYSTVIEDDVD